MTGHQSYIRHELNRPGKTLDNRSSNSLVIGDRHIKKKESDRKGHRLRDRRGRKQKKSLEDTD